MRCYSFLNSSHSSCTKEKRIVWKLEASVCGFVLQRIRSTIHQPQARARNMSLSAYFAKRRIRSHTPPIAFLLWFLWFACSSRTTVSLIAAVTTGRDACSSLHRSSSHHNSSRAWCYDKGGASRQHHRKNMLCFPNEEEYNYYCRHNYDNHWPQPPPQLFSSLSLSIFIGWGTIAFFTGMYLGRIHHIYQQKQHCYHSIKKWVNYFTRKLYSSESIRLPSFLTDEQSVASFYEFGMHLINSEDPREDIIHAFRFAIQNAAARQQRRRSTPCAQEARDANFFIQ